MRIMLSSAGFFPIAHGGGQVYVYRVAKELLKRGHEVRIVTSGPWNGGVAATALVRYTYENIPVVSFSLNPNKTGYTESQLGFGSLTMKVLHEALNEFRPDIVHINGIKPELISVCSELNIPHLVTAHHPGFVCPAGTLLTREQALCQRPAQDDNCAICCSRQRISNPLLGNVIGRLPKSISRSVGKTIGQRTGPPFLLRALAYPWLIQESLRSKRFVLDMAQLIIAPSKTIRNYILLNSGDERKVIVVPHGIEPLPKMGISPSGRPFVRFGFMGTFGVAKGFHVLVQALEQIRTDTVCELHAFGSPQLPWEKFYLEETMKSYHGVPKVIFHPRIDHRDLYKAFSEFDVLIVPSVYLEVFGLVVLEAFSVGRPVIVSKSGGPEEIVRDEIDGFVVERNNSKALAEAMQKFIDNPNLILEMSKQIRPVKTIQQYVDEIEKIYHRLISTKN